MKNQTCCLTGHRNIPAHEHAEIQKRLDEELVRLVHQGVNCFLAGGALGFDTMAAQAVLTLREAYPHICLILALPCKNQARGWPERDIKIYNQIRAQADQVVYVSEQYYSGCMQKRNRYLVDHSGVCVAYLTRPQGGIYCTVNYAHRQSVPVINLAAVTLAPRS